MVRTIYHGSRQIVQTPVFAGGGANNDYGLGFYCTEDLLLAREWAVSRERDGFVSRYTIETGGLRIIDLNGPQYTVLHWVAVLLAHRTFDIPSSRTHQAAEYIRTVFGVDYQGCDCITGYRADNCGFTFVQDFLDGRIGCRTLRELLTESGGRQFVLKSSRAMERLVFSGFEAAERRLLMPSRLAGERISIKRAEMITTRGKRGRDLFISDILESQVTPYDPRLK